MIDINKKYQTAKGAPVRLLCVDREGPYPVVGLIGQGVYSWSADGIFLRNGPDWRLVEVKEKHKISGFIFSQQHARVSTVWTHTYIPDKDILARCIAVAKVDGRPYAWAPVDLEADIHGY